jgi:FtsH-binding integral membrane protein
MPAHTDVWGQTEVAERSFVSQVFGWMCFALVITGLVAFATANSATLANAILGNKIVFYGLLIGQLLLVLGLTALINKISAAVGTAVFILYAAVNGLTLSVIFFAFTEGSLAGTFFITAGTFGIMCLIGYTTRRDLTGIGGICSMALIGLIIASIVNLFWSNSALYWITTYAGVLIFVGLTAYDMQKIKNYSAGAAQAAEGEVPKGAILGALALYLDFINLFLFFLRIFGRRRR